MITKVEETKLIRKCACGELIAIPLKDLAIKGKFIQLPLCSKCKVSLEMLHLNDQDDEHSRLVTKVFAKVATL